MNQELKAIEEELKKCASIRSPFPVLQQTEIDFVKWLLTEKSDDMIKFVKEFKEHYIKLSGTYSSWTDTDYNKIEFYFYN